MEVNLPLFWAKCSRCPKKTANCGGILLIFGFFRPMSVLMLRILRQMWPNLGQLHHEDGQFCGNYGFLFRVNQDNRGKMMRISKRIKPENDKFCHKDGQLLAMMAF